MLRLVHCNKKGDFKNIEQLILNTCYRGAERDPVAGTKLLEIFCYAVPESFNKVFMKTYLLLLSGLLLFCFQSNSQTISVSEGINIRSDHSYAIIGQLKDRILLYKDNTRDFTIQAYDEKMGLSWEKELELDKKKPTPLEIVGLKNHFYVIYRYKDNGHHLVKVHKYNASANLVDSTIVVDYGKRFTLPKPEVLVSENKENIVLFHTEFYSKLEFTSFSLKEMKVLWQEELAPGDMQHGIDFQQLLVNNDGGMHLILNRENDRLKKDKPHHFEIFSRHTNKKGVVKSKIELPEKLTYDVFFKADNLNKSLVAGGLYSEKNKSRTQGYYYLTIPNDQPSEYTLNFHDFEESLMEELVEKKSRIAKGLFDVEVQDLAIRRDGGALIICEQRKELERQQASSYGASRIDQNKPHLSASFYYEDLFILSLHPDGTRHWEKVLHKKQFAQEEDEIYSSFFLAKTPQQLRLIYNDEIQKDGIVSEYVVNGNGTNDRNSLLNTEDQELKLRLQESLQIAPNEIIVPSELNSKLKLVKVVY